MSQVEVQEVEAQEHEYELTVEQLKHKIKRLDALNKLRQNADFKFLIEDNYLKEESQRLVLLRGDSNLSKESQENLIKEIDAIALFFSFLRTVNIEGHNAKGYLDEYEIALAEVNAGEGI